MMIFLLFLQIVLFIGGIIFVSFFIAIQLSTNGIGFGDLPPKNKNFKNFIDEAEKFNFFKKTYYRFLDYYYLMSKTFEKHGDSNFPKYLENKKNIFKADRIEYINIIDDYTYGNKSIVINAMPTNHIIESRTCYFNFPYKHMPLKKNPLRDIIRKKYSDLLLEKFTDNKKQKIYINSVFFGFHGDSLRKLSLFLTVNKLGFGYNRQLEIIPKKIKNYFNEINYNFSKENEIQ